jgi:hypothetical protein
MASLRTCSMCTLYSALHLALDYNKAGSTALRYPRRFRRGVGVCRRAPVGRLLPFETAGVKAMNDAQGFPVKKAFLYVLVGSVGVSAFLGILAILSGRWGWFEVRILLTTVTIAVSSICGLACGAYLATKRGQALPLAGIALTFLAAGLIITGMWIEASSLEYWKLAATAAVFSVACAHLALLSMARLAEWFRWSLVAAYAAILGVAALISLMILGESHGSGMFQLLGVAAIIDAAISILIPILHRLSKAEVTVEEGITADAMHWNADAEIAKLRERIAELERGKPPRS